jgi:hypothetical protein
VDAYLVGETDTSGIPSRTGVEALLLGAVNDGVGGKTQFFTGQVEDLKIFGSALTLSDIREELLAQGLPQDDLMLDVEPPHLSELPLNQAVTLSVREFAGETPDDLDYYWNIYSPTWQNVGAGPGPSVTFTATEAGDYPYCYLYVFTPDGEYYAGLQHKYRFVSGAPLPLRLAQVVPPSTPTMGVPMTMPLSATGGTPPYAWTIRAGAMPPGLAMDPATGTIAGTPTDEGASFFTVRVTDAGVPPMSSEQELKLTVRGADSDGDRLPDAWENSMLPVGDRTPEGDGDADGIPNKLEFALGLDPTSPNASPEYQDISLVTGLAAEGSDQYFQMLFQRCKDLGTIAFTIQSSENLATWQNITPTETILEDNGEIQLIHVQMPMGIKPKQFLRLSTQ